MTILVTGAGGGLGKALANRLTGVGRPVVGVTRSDADLSEMDEVRSLARDIASRHPDLDVLINNAGISKFTRQVTRDGLEATFAVNYMAPFVLSRLLLPVLTRNQGAIMNIVSEQHRWVRGIPWDDLHAARRFRPIEQYSLTKLYLLMFTRELARRAPDVVVSCASPGFLRTGLGREARGSFRVFLTLARPLQRSPERGAQAVVDALDQRLTGAYFRGGKQAAPSKLAQDDPAARRLWELSLGLDPLEAPQVG
jgi:NAD(P)-dependent dehydrogenase (short-subunit alcohol dehydrogenase family)